MLILGLALFVSACVGVVDAVLDRMANRPARYAKNGTLYTRSGVQR